MSGLNGGILRGDLTGVAAEVACAIESAGSNVGCGVEAAMDRNFTSPNVLDSNGEEANLVDVLSRVADGLFAIAKAIDPASVPATGPRRPKRQLRKVGE